MKRTLFFICTILAAACQRSADQDSRSSSGGTTSTTSTTNPANPSTTTLSNRPAEDVSNSRVPVAGRAEPAGSSDKGADNTGKNERDRTGATATSGDQGGSEADRRVTQQIRKSVMDDAKLSTMGKNVKIVTEEGVVTLRGPVKNAQEKTAIGAMAQKVDGVKRVDNQLEVGSK
jgi:hypothetical protein